MILLEQLSQASLSLTMVLWSNIDLNLIPTDLKATIWNLGKKERTKTCWIITIIRTKSMPKEVRYKLWKILP